MSQLPSCGNAAEDQQIPRGHFARLQLRLSRNQEERR